MPARIIYLRVVAVIATRSRQVAFPDPVQDPGVFCANFVTSDNFFIIFPSYTDLIWQGYQSQTNLHNRLKYTGNTSVESGTLTEKQTWK